MPRAVRVCLLSLLLSAACAPAPIATRQPAIEPPVSTATVPPPTLGPTVTATAAPSPTPAVFPTAGPGEPIPCNAHDLVYAPPLKLVLLANCALESADFVPGPMKLWGWDGATWRLVDDTGPSVRGLGGVAYDTQRNTLVMAGGRSRTEDFTDMWQWDGAAWTALGAPPGTISNHFSMIYDPGRDRIVMFGGQDLNELVKSDTWEWSPEANAWERLARTGPAQRVHYALTYDEANARVLLFGNNASELWAWTGGPKWERVTPPGTEPGPGERAGSRMAYDAATGQVVLMGGYVYGANGHPLGDTWLWDGEQWTEYTGPGPSDRSHHAMAYDPERQVIVLYGGYGGGELILDDTWEWDGAAWHCVARC